MTEPDAAARAAEKLETWDFENAPGEARRAITAGIIRTELAKNARAQVARAFKGNADVAPEPQEGRVWIVGDQLDEYGLFPCRRYRDGQWRDLVEAPESP